MTVITVLVENQHRSHVQFTDFQRSIWHQNSVLAEWIGCSRHFLTIQLILTNFNPAEIQEKVLRRLLQKSKGNLDFSTEPFTLRQTQIDPVGNISDMQIAILGSSK